MFFDRIASQNKILVRNRQGISQISFTILGFNISKFWVENSHTTDSEGKSHICATVQLWVVEWGGEGSRIMMIVPREFSLPAGLSLAPSVNVNWGKWISSILVPQPLTTTHRFIITLFKTNEYPNNVKKWIWKQVKKQWISEQYKNKWVSSLSVARHISSSSHHSKYFPLYIK